MIGDSMLVSRGETARWLERAGAPIAWEDAHWAVFFGGEGEKSRSVRL